MVGVSIVKCEDYLEVERSIKKALNLLGGLNKFIKKGSKVLIKPNLLRPSKPNTAVITHPLVIEAVINLLKEINAEILIGDSCAGHDPRRTEEAFKISGIELIAKRTNSKIINFHEENFVTKPLNNKYLDKITLAQKVFEVDHIINLPKLKTHPLTFLTGAVKNLFGCVHPNIRKHLHENFSREEFGEILADIHYIINPTLNILDGVIAMEGDEGPVSGNLRNLNLILTSPDATALDIIAATITGHSQQSIPTINIKYLKKINLMGNKIADVISKDFKKHSLIKENALLDIAINKQICSKCNECMKICPVNAINDYTIDKAKCIHCYCCKEICTANAIEFK